MRLILTFLIIILNYACKTSPEPAKIFTETKAINSCPTDGICSMEILKNTSLNTKTDELGHKYPKLEPGKSMVLKYEYVRNEIPNTADSGYTEQIYIQINPELSKLELRDEELSDVSLLFGRLCFCKGQTGYYKIKTGSLSINKTSTDSYHIKLNFVSEEVPQIINQIDEIIKI